MSADAPRLDWQPAVADTLVAVVQALGGIAGLRVNSDSDLRRTLGELERPSLIEAELTESAWPGPSPFVDPAQVRLTFAANAARTPAS